MMREALHYDDEIKTWCLASKFVIRKVTKFLLALLIRTQLATSNHLVSLRPFLHPGSIKRLVWSWNGTFNVRN